MSKKSGRRTIWVLYIGPFDVRVPRWLWAVLPFPGVVTSTAVESDDEDYELAFQARDWDEVQRIQDARNGGGR